MNQIKLLLAAFACTAFMAPAFADVTVIKADRMWDAESGKISGPAVVVVTDGVIESVNPRNLPDGAKTINLGDHTLLPGLLDMHTHINGDWFTGDQWVWNPVTETAADWGIRGVVYAKRTGRRYRWMRQCIECRYQRPVWGNDLQHQPRTNRKTLSAHGLGTPARR